jgi:hypothetical protein
MQDVAVASKYCGRCSRSLDGRSSFSLACGRRCFRCAFLYRPLLYRSAKTAAVVGTLLVAINVAPSLMTGAAYSQIWKIPLNYVVPFCVATWGALSNSRSDPPQEGGHSKGPGCRMKQGES